MIDEVQRSRDAFSEQVGRKRLKKTSILLFSSFFFQLEKCRSRIRLMERRERDLEEKLSQTEQRLRQARREIDGLDDDSFLSRPLSTLSSSSTLSSNRNYLVNTKRHEDLSDDESAMTDTMRSSIASDKTYTSTITVRNLSTDSNQ